MPGIHGVLSAMPSSGNEPAKGLLKKQTVIICAGKGDVAAMQRACLSHILPPRCKHGCRKPPVASQEIGAADTTEKQLHTRKTTHKEGQAQEIRPN